MLQRWFPTKTIINEETNIHTNIYTNIKDIETAYHKESDDHPDNCLAIYNNRCYSSCPDNTCIKKKKQI